RSRSIVRHPVMCRAFAGVVARQLRRRETMPRMRSLLRRPIPSHWPWALIAAACAIAGCATPPSTPPAAPTPAQAANAPGATVAPTPAQPSFANWIADFAIGARNNGIDEATLQQAFADVHYLPEVV